MGPNKEINFSLILRRKEKRDEKVEQECVKMQIKRSFV